MLGTFSSLPFRRLALRHALDANGPRESYLRALYAQDDDGVERARVHPAQDSSLLFPFAQCNILVRRQPYAPAAKAGDFVDVINL
jgi:molybdopterin molybdotransferase